jgi:hypothetical protein
VRGQALLHASSQLYAAARIGPMDDKLTGEAAWQEHLEKTKPK